MPISNPVNDVLEWPIPIDILESPSVTNRNLFAEKFKDSSPDRILQTYAYFNCNEIEEFYNSVFDFIPNVELAGVGLELGAGTCGFTSAVCKKFLNINTIYAVELVPDVVRLLQPKTIPSICADKASKIKRIIGSFDNLLLDENYVDFSIEVESLHHSNDLTHTLSEVARVLKKDGVLVILDRSHNNKLSDEQIKFMLDVEYSDEWKINNGYDAAPLTRRDNGEHEIRLDEWISGLEKNGFKVEQRFELRVVTLKKLLRGLVLAIPFKLRKWLKILPSRVMPQEGELSWMLKSLLNSENEETSIYRHSSRDYTLIVARLQETD